MLALVLRQSLALVAIGLLLGIGGAAAGTRYLEGLLFGLTPLDPSTFAYAAVVFALVASAAAYIPLSAPHWSIPWRLCAASEYLVDDLRRDVEYAARLAAQEPVDRCSVDSPVRHVVSGL